MNQQTHIGDELQKAEYHQDGAGTQNGVTTLVTYAKHHLIETVEKLVTQAVHDERERIRRIIGNTTYSIIDGVEYVKLSTLKNNLTPHNHTDVSSKNH